MRNYSSTSAGFSAVELLITLFVAAAFLIAGYQLFNVVIKDGGETRAESAAGNVAYDYLRRYSDSATNPCVPTSPLTNQPVPIEGFTELDANISIVITCPQLDVTPTLSQVEATIVYGTGADTKTVRYATYIDKSRGATTNNDVTEGLVEWWKLNGDTTSAAGPTTLFDEGASTTTGQNGVPINAYSFSSTTQRNLRSDNFSAKMVGMNQFTVTGWVNPQNNPAAHAGYFGFRDDTIGGISLLQIAATNNLECRMRVSGSTYYQTSTITVTPNVWQLISMVYENQTLKCYVNNTVTSTVAANWSLFTAPNLSLTVGRVMQHYMNGSVDDLRIYNRALPPSDILLLVNGGAK